MASDGFRWLPMASDGFRWLPMASDGFVLQVLAHLRREETAAAERLEAARLELELIRTQASAQAEKVAEVEKQQADVEQVEAIVGQTHASLELERQKALLLVHNFAPALADELLREFPPELGT